MTAPAVRWLAGGLLLAGCSLSPLANRIDVGEEPFVVFVATGPDGRVDLYAAHAGGGMTARVTFTTLIESHPSLSLHGDVLAFVRHADTTAAASGEVVVMNLLNGAERVLPMPDGVGPVERLAWSADNRAVLLRAGETIWALAAPPAAPAARRLDPVESASADSLLDTWLGASRFALAFNCPGGSGVCLRGPSGDTTVLASRGRDPFRWGQDSVGWFEGEELMVRGLGPATPRPVSLGREAPSGLRQGTYGEQRTADSEP